MEDRLRECPFCGAEPTLLSDFKPGSVGCQTAMVRCYNCRSDGYIADSCMNETEREAINRWNTRTTDPLMEEMARLLTRSLKETPLGHQPHMIAHEVEDVLEKYLEMKDGR